MFNKKSITAMVTIHISTRLYPPKGGIIQTTGIRVAYPPPWAKMPLDFHRDWRLVVQEVEQLRLNKALKAKQDRAVCILLGHCVG